MKLLYVTDLFSGLKPILFENQKEIKGSPAFFYPLKKLVESGVDVDIVAPVFEKASPLNVGLDFLKNSEVILLQLNKKRAKRPFMDFKAIFALMKLIKKNKYDLVYCHGTFGYYGGIASRLVNVPHGFRIYGSFLYFHMKKHNKFWVGTRYYRQFLPFLQKKKFLIVTNDGTRGDKVKEAICGNSCPYDFHFLLNGVDSAFYSQQVPKDIGKRNVLFYPARIDSWKNQEFAIKTLEILTQRGYNDFELHIAGTIYNQIYWERLQNLVEELGLNEKVKYVGTLNKNELRNYFQSSFAVLSFYEFSNLGNVSIEALISGGILIARNDGSLEGIVENGVNGILVDGISDAGDQIIRLYGNNEAEKLIRRNAIRVAKEIFLSWDERSSIEINIIKEAVKKNKKGEWF